MRLALVLAAVGCHTSSWRGEAGPAAFSDPWSPLVGRHWAEHAATSLVELVGPPPSASPDARYGINIVTGGKNVAWMRDGNRFVFDANADRDLANDEVHIIPPDGALEISLRPPSGIGPALPERIVFDGDAIRAYTQRIRRGTISPDGKRMIAFAIACDPECTEPGGAVAFDLDGDGQANLDFGSFERYPLRERDRDVVIDGGAYTFEVEADGSAVTLRRAATTRPPRPTLAVGTVAPDFELDSNGAHHELSELRGHRVLLDFTAIGCHFCVEDLPWLAATQSRGIDVVTIATSGTTGDLVDPRHATWVAIEATDPGPIASLYRVDAFPTYFLIDRDGSLVCSRCRHAAIDATLAKLAP